jgi:hypothetical protein
VAASLQQAREIAWKGDSTDVRTLLATCSVMHSIMRDIDEKLMNCTDCARSPEQALDQVRVLLEDVDIAAVVAASRMAIAEMDMVDDALAR